MDKKYTSREFLLSYLTYLTKWNETASLLGTMESMDNISNEELANIALFEYDDTKRMTTDHVMSIEEVMEELKRDNRDRKINDILK